MRRERLKTLCPTLGKVKIAQILARAGLHLGATTVGRILKELPAPFLLQRFEKIAERRANPGKKIGGPGQGANAHLKTYASS
jgi:hypothetical protein